MDGKACSKCGHYRLADDFHKDKRLKGGLSSNCKPCMRVASNKWKAENQERVNEGVKKYREENSEKYKETKRQSDARSYLKNKGERLKYQVQYRAENQEKIQKDQAAYRIKNQEKLQKYRNLYYRENRERLLEAQKQSNAKNIEKVKQRKTKWYKANPDKVRMGRARRKAKKRKVLHSPYSRDGIFRRDKGACHLCGILLSPDSFHLDHVVPISLGGSDTPDNIRVACPPCNLSKHTKILGQINLFEYARLYI